MGHPEGNSMSKRYDEVTDQDRLDAIGRLEAYGKNVRHDVSSNGRVITAEFRRSPNEKAFNS